MLETQILGEKQLERAVEALKRSEVCALPSETVYGLAGNGIDEKAILKIFSAKERPKFDPLILHIPSPETFSNLEMLKRLDLVNFSLLSPGELGLLDLLLQRFWPGPLTLVLPKTKKVPDLVTSGLETVAIRMPKHPIFQAVLKKLDFPLAAPSANRFGNTSPTEAAHVFEELNNRIALIVDGGPCEYGLESTIIQIGPNSEPPRVTLLRPGAISVETIQEVAQEALGYPVAVLPPHELSPSEALLAPGMSLSHYAPKKPLYWIKNSEDLKRLRSKTWISSFGLILFSDEDPLCLVAKKAPSDHSRTLSQKGSFSEAAQNLFRTIRELDKSAEITEIYCVFPETQKGLGYAICDRLKRAAKTSSSL